MSFDWEPLFELPEGTLEFKWGLNSQTGEIALWEVGGPGDGFPTHDQHLSDLWGRAQRSTDSVGYVTVDANKVTVVAFYGARVPDALLALLRERFPHATVVVVPT